jgi:hypothetical protein
VSSVASAQRAVSAWPAWRGAAHLLLVAGVLLTGGWAAAAAFDLYLETHHFSPFGDARWYADALWRLFTEQPLYDRRLLEPHVVDLTYRYNLPPPLALLAPLFAVPAGALLWGWCMAGSLLVGIAVVFPRLRTAWAALLLAAIAAWPPIHAALVWANANALVMLLLALALRFPRHAGWAIGAAASVKFVPILMVAWLLGRRDWRQALVAVAVPVTLTAVVAILEGPQVVTDFIAVRLSDVSEIGDEQWGLVPMGFLPVVGYVVGGAIAAMAAWRASFTLGVIAMLVAVPDLHLHYWIWLLVPLLGILPRAQRGSRLRRWAIPSRQLRRLAAGVVVVLAMGTGAWLIGFDSTAAATRGDVDVRLSGGADGPTRYFVLDEGRYHLTLAPGAGETCYLSAWLRSRHVLTFAAYLGGAVVGTGQAWSRDVSVAPGEYFVDVHSAGCGWTVAITQTD